jgi:hypothetical protein
METRTSENARDLAAALRKYLGDIQSENARELGPTWGAGGRYDMLADTGVWIGEEIKRFTGHTAPDVVLHYDGAGYDYLSYDTCIQRYRSEILAIAQRLGYGMEDLNCWSCAFYTLS